jgi:hypothetical protein
MRTGCCTGLHNLASLGQWCPLVLWGLEMSFARRSFLVSPSCLFRIQPKLGEVWGMSLPALIGEATTDGLPTDVAAFIAACNGSRHVTKACFMLPFTGRTIRARYPSC